MPRIKHTTLLSEHKIQHIGTVYRLIEQFELISRTDLAKISGFAPATITSLTKALIDNKFIIERTTQSATSKGRPAVGLCVSTFHWQLLCITISPHHIEISLCELNGKTLTQSHYPLQVADYARLDDYLLHCIREFYGKPTFEESSLLAISVSIIGRINADKDAIIRLGDQTLHIDLLTKLQAHFFQPVLLNEHFQLWLLAESTVGNLMSSNNVIFLQLDEQINISLLLKGSLLHQQKQTRMSVDKMYMPRFSELSELSAPDQPDLVRYQLKNQISFEALAHLVDAKFPNNFTELDEKIALLCAKIEAQNPQALAILAHITDNLAYVLMNLINIFSSEKVMISSPLLQVKTQLCEQLQAKLQHNLLLEDAKIDVVTSQYAWNSSLIPCSAIKNGIYDGTLIKNIIQL